jgi:hypothetical protein
MLLNIIRYSTLFTTYPVGNTNVFPSSRNQNFGTLILLNTNSHNFNSSLISPSWFVGYLSLLTTLWRSKVEHKKPKYSNMYFQDVTTGSNDRGEKRVFLVDYITYHCYLGQCSCRVEQGVSQSVTHCD